MSFLEKRIGNIAFSKPKAIRLAFHDCMPYEDGSGGCDGCLSFEENGQEHNVLQHTVAILVSKAPFQYLVLPIQVSVYSIRKVSNLSGKTISRKGFSFWIRR